MTDNELWDRWQKSRSSDIRDALILRYMPLVRYVATKQIAMRWHTQADPDDLVSYGVFGLIDAIEKFDPTRGWKFETYAVARIKGAILDELRGLDWIPRSVRSQVKSIDSARTRLEATLHRQPSLDELAAETGLNQKDLSAALHEVSTGAVGVLDQDDDLLEDRHGSRHSGIEVDEIRGELTRALSTLADREAVVFILYYRERLTLAEIGVVLGVTESRVVQIHSEAVQRVCRALAT